MNLWPGPAPGSESWTHQERTVENTPIGTVVLSVVTPTLTAFLPRPGEGTGTGVIIAPGGAFVALAIDLEGTSVAPWLQAKGIAAFVLKYRVIVRFHEALQSAGHKLEVHVFSAGGHGFATRKQGTSCDHWMDILYSWIEAQGLTRPAGKPGP